MTLSEALAQLGSWREGWSRLGEWWPQGPAVDRSTVPVGLDQFLVPVAELQDSFPDDLAATHRALRRLHYSRHARWTEGYRRGVRLDALISGDSADLPPTWSASPPGPSQQTLDNLGSAAYLTVPPSSTPGAPVDLGAVFSATDAALSGPSDLGSVAELTTGTTSDGITGWAGDLAAWFLEWNARRLEASAKGEGWTQAQAAEQLTEMQGQKVPLELMLGTLDGQIMAAHYRSYLRQAVTPEEQHYGTIPDLLDAATLPADTLQGYYADSAPADFPHVSSRFPLFVEAATPLIPHASDPVSLGPDARETVRESIAGVAAFCLYHGCRDKAFGLATATFRSRPPIKPEDAVAEVEEQGEVIEEISTRFVGLLQAGLDDMEPAWPVST